MLRETMHERDRSPKWIYTKKHNNYNYVTEDIVPVTLQVQEKLKYNQVVNMSKAKAKHELLPVCSNNLAQER